MSFLSLAVMPVLLSDILSDESARARRTTLLDELARFNGELFARGLAPQ